ncbi:MAG: spore coat protein [Lachnospiraceae bacterium]|nr:spore coat protein [Lachnospiraceae bacterium]
MKMLTQKESGLLKDLKGEEELCIEKYGKYAKDASNPKLKELMETIKKKEETHLDTINKIMNGDVPVVSASGKPQEPKQEAGRYTNGSPEYNNDKYICSDALSTEKHVSSVYNTSIFEFKDMQIRNNLNHIQKEEQEHGEMIYNYMAQNGMYN